VEDIKGRGPAAGMGNVVVADEKKNWDAGLPQADDAAGKLPLEGRGGVPVLVGVPGEKNQVDLLRNGVIDHMVEGLKEVADPG